MSWPRGHWLSIVLSSVAPASAGGLGTACVVVDESYCCSTSDCPSIILCSEERPYCDEGGQYPESGGVGRRCILDPFSGPCDTSDDCSTERPVCQAGTCVQCAGNDDCGAALPVCGTARNLCEPCASDEDCADRAETPRCFLGQGACMACLDAGDCTTASAPVCDDDSHTCRRSADEVTP